MDAPLATAFGIGTREVVTIVGGGGKTTTLFRLGRELHQRGGTVVSTTTHIMLPPPETDLETVTESDPRAGLEACRAAIARGHLPVLGTRATSDGRLGGVEPDVVDLCAAQADVAYVVNEGDGSAHKPFKAPLEHEPVVPRSTTVLICVVGVDALGQPLDAEHIHRPQRVSELSGATLGRPVTADTIVDVLVHPLGPLRDAPRQARVLVLLNKADSPARREAASVIAEALRRRSRLQVLIGAVAAATPF